MTAKDIIAQLLERGLAMQTYWGFYITVALGLVVFFGNAKHTKRLPYLALLVSVVFVGFAYVNCSGMFDISSQRNALFEILQGLASATPAPAPLDLKVIESIIKTAKPDTAEQVRNFHILVDVLILLAIWTLALWRINDDDEPADSTAPVPASTPRPAAAASAPSPSAPARVPQGGRRKS